MRRAASAIRRAIRYLSRVAPLLLAAPALGQTIDVSLNVFYANPGSINSGGTWEIVAKSGPGTVGIAGVSLLLTNISTAINEGPRGNVNGSDPAGFSQFFNTPHPLGFRNVTVGQAPLPPSALGAGDEQGVFYGVGTLINGAPNYAGKPPATNSIGPVFTSLTNVNDVPWASGEPFSDPAWITAARLASGTFTAGLTPGFSTGGEGFSNTGNVFTTVGSSTSYGTIAEATITTIVRTSFNGTLLPDYNRNGFVDAADYVLWRNTAGQSGMGLAADGNGDGTVNQADYDLWRANYGAIAGAAAGNGSFAMVAPAQSAIPEPSTSELFALCGLIVVLASCGRRRMCRDRHAARNFFALENHVHDGGGLVAEGVFTGFLAGFYDLWISNEKTDNRGGNCLTA